MMKIKLKKFSILEPKVKIITGIKTIDRETHSSDNLPVNAIASASGTNQAIIGNLEILEE